MRTSFYASRCEPQHDTSPASQDQHLSGFLTDGARISDSSNFPESCTWSPFRWRKQGKKAFSLDLEHARQSYHAAKGAFLGTNDNDPQHKGKALADNGCNSTVVGVDRVPEFQERAKTLGLPCAYPGPRPNSRQMDVIEHLLRQTETSGETVTKLISSADNPADLMTKCLSATTHEKHTRSYLQVAPQTLISKQVERSATSLSAIQPFSFQNSPLVILPTTEPEFFQDGLTFALISRNYSDEQLLLSKHKSLGHRNMEDVARLYSIPYKKIFCRDCVENKSTRHPLTGKSGRTLEAPRPGHTIDADVCSFPDKTKGGNSYLSVLIDRVSSRIDARLIRTPSDFFDHYTSFVKYCESHFGKTNIISVLHSDSAAYYLDSRRLADFNRARGIRQTFSPPYTQSLNGRAGGMSKVGFLGSKPIFSKLKFFERF